MHPAFTEVTKPNERGYQHRHQIDPRIKRQMVLILFFWAPKSLQMVTAAMKLKDAYSWEEKL